MTPSFQHRFKAFVEFQQLIPPKEFSLTSVISLTQSKSQPRFIKLSETWMVTLTPSSFATELSISWVVLTETCQNGISFTRSMLGPQCKSSPFACHSWEWLKDQQLFYLHQPVKFHGLDTQFITRPWPPSTWWSDAPHLRTLTTKSELTLSPQATSDLKLLEAIKISKTLLPQSKTKASSVKQPWTLRSWATLSPSALVMKVNSLTKFKSLLTLLSQCYGKGVMMLVSWTVKL